MISVLLAGHDRLCYRCLSSVDEASRSVQLSLTHNGKMAGDSGRLLSLWPQLSSAMNRRWIAGSCRFRKGLTGYVGIGTTSF